MRRSKFRKHDDLTRPYPQTGHPDSFPRLPPEGLTPAEVAAANMPLIVSVARRYVPKSRIFDFEDRIMSGYFALVYAAEKFDRKRGIAFSTLATLAIMRRLQRDDTELWRRERRDPYSLDYPILDEEGGELRPLANAMRAPGADPGEQLDVQALRALLPQLPPSERRVIEADLAGYTGTEQAAVEGVLRNTISVRRLRAYQRLRTWLEEPECSPAP